MTWSGSTFRNRTSGRWEDIQSERWRSFNCSKHLEAADAEEQQNEPQGQTDRQTDREDMSSSLPVFVIQLFLDSVVPQSSSSAELHLSGKGFRLKCRKSSRWTNQIQAASVLWSDWPIFELLWPSSSSFVPDVVAAAAQNESSKLETLMEEQRWVWPLTLSG